MLGIFSQNIQESPSSQILNDAVGTTGLSCSETHRNDNVVVFYNLPDSDTIRLLDYQTTRFSHSHTIKLAHSHTIRFSNSHTLRLPANHHLFCPSQSPLIAHQIFPHFLIFSATFLLTPSTIYPAPPCASGFGSQVPSSHAVLNAVAPICLRVC
jgi:hypothetical protein